MTESADDRSMLPPPGPSWSTQERAVWLELYTQFLQIFVSDTVDDTSDLAAHDMGAFREDCKTAAELADIAMQELQFRFLYHPHRRRTRTRTTAQTKTTPKGKR